MVDRHRRGPGDANPGIGFRSFEEAGVRWAHTIGLLDRGMPELLVSGLDRDTGLAVLRKATQDLIDRSGAVDGDVSDRIADRSVMFRSLPLERAGRFAMEAANRDPAQFHALQVVWPDGDGRFPWAPGCDPEVARAQRVIVDLEPPTAGASPRPF
ncbi:hypothetical protein BHAOGJBA_4174 [Methylobacterium hispanicum]|uniref:DUF4262 domain-containing protein n=1 Tax=Methylobacterium hispanicum TaxID=270350 RepID=A0AAV4ZR21_9HYPH|nr:DUF4262 domain-containing protein [Methylobacterium hispanicum]GJD90632.1 hypothetical protein BHAOGJBA_4174 [Methylobacterium hispanicum]